MDNYFSLEADITLTNDRKLSPGKIYFKTTEKSVDFLVYVAKIYTLFVPSFKEIYLTLNSWRPERTKDGLTLPGYKGDISGVVEDGLVTKYYRETAKVLLK